jgi:hypothetical protein
MTERGDDLTGGGPAADEVLARAFAAARADRAAPPPDPLMARIAADALRHLPAAPAARAPVRRGGLLRELFAQIGGWPAIGGLATAGLAGFWIGFQPEAAAGLGYGALIDTLGVQTVLLPDDYSDLTDTATGG